MNNLFTLHLGDCLESLRTMADNSADSIVTDPPYGLSFMGKKWDYDVPGVDVWAECLRVLKPGGHLLAFAGTRTQHRMAVRIEDAGFEIRDMIAWVYGSGFPKSLDVSKAIDKAAGAEREVVGYDETRARPNRVGKVMGDVEYDRSDNGATITAPATEAARQWQGWGTALKPSLEPVTVARKPLIGTVAENVLEHGTGGLNIDGCRVGAEIVEAGRNGRSDCDGYSGGLKGQQIASVSVGRWPANLILSDDPEVVGVFPNAPGQQGPISSTAPSAKTSNVYGAMKREGEASQDSNNTGAVGFKMKPGARRLDQGSAARFFKQVSPDAEDIATAQRLFYCAKASKRDRDEGLEGFEAKATAFGNQAQAELKRGNLDHDDGKSGMNKVKMRQNSHPTVKPTDLMAYLCRLVTPPGGVVLDPFMGSGSTGKAAIREGFQFIGCEMSPEYMDIARARIQHEVDKIEAARVVTPQPDLFA
jgi:site-specific DNA-methyltransferase (adenine-specific)